MNRWGINSYYKNNILKKMAAIVLVTSLGGSVVHMEIIQDSQIVYADVTTDDLNSAKNTKSDINAQIQDTQTEIARLQQQAGDTQAYIAQLDSKMSELDTSLNNLNNNIALKQEEIVNAQEGLAQAELDSQEQNEAMKLRIKFMYENNNETYFEILLSSNNMGEMLNKAEYITQISQYDREMLERYQETVDYIANTKVQLENDYVQLDNMAASVEAEKGALEIVQQAKNTELANLNTQTNVAKEKESSLHADLAAQESAIEQMEAQIAAQEAARKEEERRKQEAAQAAKSQLVDNSSNSSGNASLDNSSNNSNSNSGGSSDNSSSVQQTSTGFIWPTVSRRITSDYGDTEDRDSGHKGIDIGATTPGVSGDPIYAAKGGTVTIATYSSSAGNWIWIYHGDGLYTVYMHCSALLVSVGDTVSQGQVIAKMGSTGNSTGAHLHFGVRLNGSYVNPWGYLG